ncbi:MAG: KH domain-containing protein [archaeon]|jgi:NusA-like KH domain protein|nr:KH domain-containing protein [archaeon]
MTTLNMQIIRYINLLDRISRVKTRNCFLYNNSIIFAVPRRMVPQAIGAGAENIRALQEQLGKRIRIVAESEGMLDAERFVRDIVAPVKFKSLEMKDGGIVINAGMASKASLIGRNKKRLEELHQIVKDTFGFDLKIV